MIQHYIKIAFRNLLKHKTQTLISIIGLAIGYTSFALATLWVHYEMTYDNFHEGADRIYFVGRRDIVANESSAFASTYLPFSIHQQLKREFPEIESSCVITYDRISIDSIPDSYMVARVDSSFMKMFNIEIQEGGTIDFLYSADKIAITDAAAKRLYGNTLVIGEKVNERQTICAVVSGFGEHTNLKYDFLSNLQQTTDASRESYMTLIRLHKGTDASEFHKKLVKVKIEIETNQSRTEISKNFGMIPITQYHYRPQNAVIQIHYLKLFALVGFLVILCSLINYLFLFASRLCIRSREINLRKVCGSSLGQIYLMLTIEFLFILLISGMLGMMFIELTLPGFKELSRIDGSVYGEASLFYIAVSILALCMMSPVILHRKKTTKGNRHLFSKFALAIQFCISMLFIFCMIVLMKQISFLRNADIGIERKGVAAINSWEISEEELAQLNYEIKKLPIVDETLPEACTLIPYSVNVAAVFSNWDNKKEEDTPIGFSCIYHTVELARFYGINLKEGEMLNADDTHRVLINETAVKKLGVKQPLGMRIGMHIVIGIVKDFHNTAPTEPVQPMMFLQNDNSGVKGPWCCENNIIIKYEIGQWETIRQNIDSLMELKMPGRRYWLRDAEQEYEEEMRSESMLILILSIMSTVCVLISAFGIYSFVTLSCEQRRKEIAVRKVNGATLKDILGLFAKEYLNILILAAIFAFPVGYTLMKYWLSDYIEQTNISAWIYYVIFFGTALIIAFCISWRVWQAAKQNPAKTIKTE